MLVFLTHTGQHAVEDVVIAFARILCYDARLFEQILLDVCPFDHAVLVETNVDVFSKAG